MIRSYALAATAALMAFTGVDARAADPLPTKSHKVLTAALALEAAEAAVAACKAQGYNVTVTIVDRTGATKLVLVGDGARPLTLEVTRRKAYTSAMQRVSTGDFTKRVSTPGAFNPGMFDSQLTPVWAACRSRSAKTRSAASRLPARPAATRMKPAPTPASTRSRTG
jgi:hypothetical protein